MIRIALHLAMLLFATAIAPANASDPQNLATALKQGGYVIVFRHGATDESQKDIYPFRFDDMKAQRQLSDKGRETARAHRCVVQGARHSDWRGLHIQAQPRGRDRQADRGKDVTPKDELTDSGAGSASSMANPDGNNEKFGRPLRELAGTGASASEHLDRHAQDQHRRRLRQRLRPTFRKAKL